MGGVILTTKETIQISLSMVEMNTRNFFWFKMRDKIEGKIMFEYVRHCCQSLNLAEWWFCNTTHEIEPGALSFLRKLLPIGPLLRSYDNKIGITKAIGQYWEEDLSCMN
ncbi:hypothetical protein V8G54_013049 [Vigna mungo]|uniref:Uncharacterized protein n=1 Tax=Vigna mungo TaxID=3915 RepID=A0AAQ3S3Y3_VIGMU